MSSDPSSPASPTPKASVAVGPSGLLALAGLFAYEQAVLLWIPLLFLSAGSPSSGVVLNSLFGLLAVMLLPVGVFLFRDRGTPRDRRGAMFFCAIIATCALFVTNAGDPASAVGMVVALVLSEISLVLRPHRGITTWRLTTAYTITILALYATVVWSPVLVASFEDESMFVRPGVPGLISWYVVHVWALIGLGRQDSTA